MEGNIENFTPPFENLYEAANFSYGLLKDSILIVFKLEEDSINQISQITFCDIKNNKLLFSYHYFNNKKIAISKYLYEINNENVYVREFIQLNTKDVFLQDLEKTKISHYFNVDFNRLKNNIELSHNTYEKNCPKIYIYLDVFNSD